MKQDNAPITKENLRAVLCEEWLNIRTRLNSAKTPPPPLGIFAKWCGKPSAKIPPFSCLTPHLHDVRNRCERRRPPNRRYHARVGRCTEVVPKAVRAASARDGTIVSGLRAASGRTEEGVSFPGYAAANPTGFVKQSRAAYVYLVTRHSANRRRT